jgi:hypothetical protein
MPMTKEGVPNSVFRSRSASTARPGCVRDPPTWTGSTNEGIVQAERRYGGSGRLNSRPPIPAHADVRASSLRQLTRPHVPMRGRCLAHIIRQSMTGQTPLSPQCLRTMITIGEHVRVDNLGLRTGDESLGGGYPYKISCGDH